MMTPASMGTMADAGEFTSKERDAETGLDYFGARYMSSAQGRFTSPDPSNQGVDFWLPQTWNRYAYVMNNPLRLKDDNGLWPTFVHESIIYTAFPGLRSNELTQLTNGSYNTDYKNSVNGLDPQNPAVSFVHGMSNGVAGQGPAFAEAQSDTFVADNIEAAQKAQAEWTAAGNLGLSPKALLAFGNALHTITDRTSPTHRGYQPWRGTGTARNNLLGFLHVLGELYVPDQARQQAVGSAQYYFFLTFGAEAYSGATGNKAKPKEPKACVEAYDSNGNGTGKVCQ